LFLLFWCLFSIDVFVFSLNVNSFKKCSKRPRWLLLKSNQEGWEMKPSIVQAKGDAVYFAQNTAHVGAGTRGHLLKEKLLPFRRASYKNSGSWKGRKVTLENDCINGEHFNNRLENLRFLCPDRPSQTLIYGGENVRSIPLAKEAPKNGIISFENSAGGANQKEALLLPAAREENHRWTRWGSFL